MESVAKETYLKREIEESYEQLETTFDEEDEDENLYKNKIKTINQKIKKLKYEKKKLKLEYKDSQYEYYKCRQRIRNSIHSLYTKLECLNID